MTLLLERKEKEKLRMLRCISALLIISGCIAIGYMLLIQNTQEEELCITTERTIRRKPSKQPNPQLSVFPVNEVKESLFLPSLVKKLKQHNTPPRPDTKENFVYLEFANNPYCKMDFGQLTYLSIEGDTIKASDTRTPLTLSLSEDGGSCTLGVSILAGEESPLLSESYTFSIADIPQVHRSGDGGEFVNFCTEISSLRLYPPDQFFQLFGGEKLKPKGQACRLGSSFTQVYCIKEGDIFTLQMGELVPIANPSNAQCQLVKVKKIAESGALLEAWDASGKEYTTIAIQSEIPKTILTRPEEIFKDVRVKGRGKAVVKVGKKTKILSQGDYLLNENGRWVLVDKKDTLERLINYLQSGILFVFEGFVEQGSTTMFVGTLFDETRSLSKKVQIPIKSKPVPRNPSRTMRRAEHSNRAMPSDEGIPPELEDLFDELDSL